MNLLTGLTLVSSISFLCFGAACLFDARMKDEFIRYRLADRRRLTGFLQILGGIGLLLGWLFFSLLALFACLGLTLLMVLGFGVRIKIKDTWLQALPSLSYALLNAYLAILYLSKL
ncbi:DoxX family protein [Pricia sp.]|uniref:DoxX family protein n=1 Tax=Pricia sp. TaxID=2268138 RepID=UPI003593FD85